MTRKRLRSAHVLLLQMASAKALMPASPRRLPRRHSDCRGAAFSCGHHNDCGYYNDGGHHCRRQQRHGHDRHHHNKIEL